MSIKSSPTQTIGRRLLKIGGYALAFAIPPLLIGAIMFMKSQATLTAPAETPYTGPAAEMPAHDPAKPTVVLVASNDGTEITDLMAPYAVFTTADAFNVYVVAAEHKVTPFLWGGLDIMPHYSFAELEQLLNGKPDVIVMPFIKNPEDPTIVQWIRSQAGPETLLVSICAGARVLAATGLADGSQITTHQSTFGFLAEHYPQIQLVRDVRYTDSGNIITSAGITSGIDASLYAIQRLLGQDTAQMVATRLNYPHTQFLTAPEYQLPTDAPTLAAGLNAAFLWQRAQIGVPLFEGVDEMDLTAVLDTYGQTFTATALTFAPERKVIHSRHGLQLIPREDYASAPHFDRLIIPGEATALVAGLTEWAETQQGVTVEALYPAGLASDSRPFAFDSTLVDAAQWRSSPDARIAARSLEYPTEHLQLADTNWPVQRAIPALLIGLLSLGSALWLGNQRSKQQRIEAA